MTDSFYLAVMYIAVLSVETDGLLSRYSYETCLTFAYL